MNVLTKFASLFTLIIVGALAEAAVASRTEPIRGAKGPRPKQLVQKRDEPLKLHSGNTFRVITDFERGSARWEISAADGNRLLQTREFKSDFLKLAKSVRFEKIASFDPDLDLVLVEFLPVLQIVLFGDGALLEPGPEIGPMAEMKSVIAQRFDFTKLKSDQTISAVNVSLDHKETVFRSYHWNGKFFAASDESR